MSSFETNTKILEDKLDNPFKAFLAGGFGGITSTLVGHPFDTIKVLLQTMPLAEAGQEPLYKSSLDCTRKTIQSHGFMALYRGITAPLVGVAPIFAICFATYAWGRKYQTLDDKIPLSNKQIFLAGAFSGVCTTIIVAPGERIKVLLQTQNTMEANGKHYNGIWDAVIKLYHKGGLKCIFNGTMATLLRDVPGNGVFFLTYELIKQKLESNTEKHKHGLLMAIFAGGLTGMIHSIISLPPDVLKNRLQNAPYGAYPKGVRSVFAEVMRHDGIMGFYKGLPPVLLRAIPSNAATFLGIELANEFFKRFLPNF